MHYSTLIVFNLQGVEVTKVRLYPRTGRRHQLRIHSLCLGHPIVGDFTYNPQQREAVLAEEKVKMKLQDEQDQDQLQLQLQQQENISSGGSPVSAERMMLHAHHLR